MILNVWMQQYQELIEMGRLIPQLIILVEKIKTFQIDEKNQLETRCPRPSPYRTEWTIYEVIPESI